MEITLKDAKKIRDWLVKANAVRAAISNGQRMDGSTPTRRMTDG